MIHPVMTKQPALLLQTAFTNFTLVQPEEKTLKLFKVTNSVNPFINPSTPHPPNNKRAPKNSKPPFPPEYNTA